MDNRRWLLLSGEIVLNKSIIRIAATLTTTLLLAGCVAKLDPAQNGAPIGFSAGPALLRDDDVKSGSVRGGGNFVTYDKIAVYGWHQASSSSLVFGSVDPVELGSSGQWSYSPLCFWQWQGSSDYYDFLALYPNELGQSITYNPMKANFTYDPTMNQFDFMTASFRRNASDGSANDAVPLSFSHRLAAVSVRVSNPEGGKAFQLESCRFCYLIVRAQASVTYKNTSLSTTWTDKVRSAAASLGSAPATDLAPESSLKLDSDFMIPQRLDPLGYTPALVLTYKPKTGENTYGASITSTVPLKSILKQDKETPIVEWVAGVSYTYQIVVRIGGGISVNVTTTPWDVVEAETPGILI